MRLLSLLFITSCHAWTFLPFHFFTCFHFSPDSSGRVYTLGYSGFKDNGVVLFLFAFFFFFQLEVAGHGDD